MEPRTERDKNQPSAAEHGALLAARIKATVAALYLEKRLVLYKQTGNAIHAWWAFYMARAGGVPIPEWVLSYLEGVAQVLAAPNGPSSPRAIATALEIATSGGPSKVRQAKTDLRDLDILEDILHLKERAEKGAPDLDLKDHLGVMQRVADHHKLSLDRVQAIYYKMIRPDNRRHRDD